MEIHPCSWVGRINTVKMAILIKAIYPFNAIPIKIPTEFFNELEKIILKFIHIEPQNTSNSQSNPEKEEQRWGDYTSHLQALLQSHGNQDNLVLAQNRHTDQQNRIESPDINPIIYGQLIYDKGARNIP